MVIDLPAGATADVDSERGAVLVRVTGAALRRAARPPHNVAAVEVTGSDLRLTPEPQTTWNARRRTRQLIIDVFDAKTQPQDGPKQKANTARLDHKDSPPPPRHFARSPPLPAVSPESMTVPAVAAAPPSDQPAADRPAARSEPPTGPGTMPLPPGPEPIPSVGPKSAQPDVAAAAPVTPVEQAALPAEALPSRLMSSSAPGPVAIAVSIAGPALTLPFAAGTGAAMFHRGSDTIIVFDERRPLDLEALRDDPQFGTARVQLLPAATMVRVALPAGTTLALAHNPAAGR